MLKKRNFLIGAVILCIGQFCSELRAAAIRGVTIQAVSSEFASGADQRRATNLVTGVGLFGDVHTTTAAGSMWATSPTNAGSVSLAAVTFNLGSVHTLNRMKVWNYNEAGANTQRGIKLANISVAGEDLVFTTHLANVTFTRAPGTFTNASQTIDLGGIQARYVRINVLTNFYTTGAVENRVGLSKVLFIDDTVPPVLTAATRSYSGTQVTVRFSESVLPSTATNATNYAIFSGTTSASILSVAMNVYNDGVVLQTSPLDTNLVYTLSAQNVRDAADVISIASTNVTIDPELVLWLKADAGVAVDGNNVLTQWSDQSGLNNHALPVTNAPTLVAGAVNGRPVVHFDGTQILEVANHPSLVVSRDITIYTVISLDTLAAPGHGLLSKCQVNIPSSFDLQIVASTGKPSIVRGNGSGFTTFAGSTTGLGANTQYYIVSVVTRGTNATHYLNGNFNGSGLIMAGLGDTGTNLRLGFRQDGGTKFRGNMAETMVLRGAVTDAERSAIDSYLRAKYGISDLTLAITSQPFDATRLVGQTATFGVSAIAGSPTIFYQWQRGTTNIVGATNSTYTTPVLTLANNNSTYRAVVSTPSGLSTNSSFATLTVLADTQAPVIFSATRKAGSATDIVVVFSEAVATSSAANIANYSLNDGVTISAAVMGSAANQVIITTSGLSAGTTYYLTVENVQDLFGNTMVPASLQILPANLVLWLKADSGVVTNGSGLVSEWTDLSASGNTALQYRGVSLMPTLVPWAMNGKPALRFDGIRNYLEAASSPSLAITGDMTIYAVANFTDYNGIREIISKTAGNQPASFDYYVQNSTHTRFYRGNGTVNNLVTALAPSAGVPHRLAVVMQGTNVSHFLDGNGNGTGILSTPMADSGTPLRIGSRNDLAQYMKGDLGEIMVFSAAILDADRQAIDGYFANKYELVADPVSLVLQRSGSDVVISWPVTPLVFAVEANANLSTAGWIPVTNSITISGGTNSLTVTPAGSGRFYRLVGYKPSPPLNIVGQTNLVISGLRITNSAGNGITISGSSNITVVNCWIGPCTGSAVTISSSEGVTISSNRLEKAQSGVYVANSRQISITRNRCVDVQGPFPRGQLAQFNNVSGSGNSISSNVCVNTLGQSYPEDVINLYNSSGTPTDPIQVIGNRIRGGGPSESGGGIMTGDGGGSYILVKDNILVDPGQYGIAIASGDHIQIIGNKVYGKRQPFTNVGIYVWNQYAPLCHDHVVQGNQVRWYDRDGNQNPAWNANNCGLIEGWNDNNWYAELDDTILPEDL